MTKEERKQAYLNYVLSKSQGIDNIDEVLKEASEKWENENPNS